MFPSGVDAWKVTRLDQPTARYWFHRSNGERVAHEVGMQQSTVTDTQTGEVIGRYVMYYRQAPWFFVSIAAPAMGCDQPGARSASGSFLIYQSVLRPAQ